MHAVELFRQGRSLAIELADPILDALEAVAPLPLFLESEEHAGGVHRGGTPEVRHYLTMTCPFSSFLRLGSRDHVPKRSKRFIAWFMKSLAIPSPASTPNTSSRLSIFQTLTRFATVRCVDASLTLSFPIRFSPSRFVESETT